MNRRREVLRTIGGFKRRSPRLFCAALLTLMLLVSAAGQTVPLGLGDLIVGLRAAGGSYLTKNARLAADVKKRGVDFALSPEIEAVLRRERADESLIAAIRASKGSGAVSALKPGTLRKSPTGIELVWIPPGEFMMGSSEAEIDQAWAECKKWNRDCERERLAAEAPKHKVTIRDGFWMGRYEVTQGDWQSVMGDNPSSFKDCGPRCPVEQVSWDDIQVFLKRLNSKDSGFEYSLPSEAQWEYAARAGTTTTFAFGNSLSSTQANFNGNYPYGAGAKGPYLERTATVGSYRPNTWGLYDMHGNVWEWVEDIYNENGYSGLPTDGSANLSVGYTRNRVPRGGSWYVNANIARSAVRYGYEPSGRGNFLGFRVLARPK